MANPFLQNNNNAPAANNAAAQSAPAASNPPAQQAAQQPIQQNTQAQQAAQQPVQAAPKPKRNLSDMFNNGASVNGDKLTDHAGQAVLVRITGYTPEMSTKHGTTDSISADWVVLDGPQQGNQFSGMIFSRVIVASLKQYFQNGQTLCVGVVAQGEAKNGNSAPWLLNPLDDAQLELAGQAVEALGW